MVRSTAGIQPRFTAVRQTSSWERSRRVLHRLHQVAVLLGAEFRYRPFVRLTGRLEPTGLLEGTQRFPCPSAHDAINRSRIIAKFRKPLLDPSKPLLLAIVKIFEEFLKRRAGWQLWDFSVPTRGVFLRCRG